MVKHTKKLDELKMSLKIRQCLIEVEESVLKINLIFIMKPLFILVTLWKVKYKIKNNWK